MCHYTNFTTEERELSRVLKAQGLSIRAIARNAQSVAVISEPGIQKKQLFQRYIHSSQQLFPKGTSFADISDDDLQIVVGLINNRPRKRLNYLTPYEVLKKFFS